MSQSLDQRAVSTSGPWRVLSWRRVSRIWCGHCCGLTLHGTVTAWVTDMARVPSLAWDLPYASGMAKKKKKKKTMNSYKWPIRKKENWKENVNWKSIKTNSHDSGILHVHLVHSFLPRFHASLCSAVRKHAQHNRLGEKRLSNSSKPSFSNRSISRWSRSVSLDLSLINCGRSQTSKGNTASQD